MMINGKFLLSMALLLLVAGCVSTQRPVKVSASDGLTINSFSADLNDVFGMETTRLFLEVENVGGTTAKSVQAQLFGGVSSWTGADAMGAKSIGDLNPPLLNTNVPGDFSRLVFSIVAPDLAQGLEQSYDIGVRVVYGYTTTSVTPVDVISYDQFDQLRKAGTFEQTTTATQNSNAPIKLSLEIPTPMRPRSATTPISETVVLSVANVGTGVAFYNSGNAFPTASTLGKITMTITGSGLTCAFDSSNGNPGTMTTTGTVTLTRGFDTVKVPCIYAPIAPDAGLPKKTNTLSITATYGYAIDSMLPIKVTSKN